MRNNAPNPPTNRILGKRSYSPWEGSARPSSFKDLSEIYLKSQIEERLPRSPQLSKGKAPEDDESFLSFQMGEKLRSESRKDFVPQRLNKPVLHPNSHFLPPKMAVLRQSYDQRFGGENWLLESYRTLPKSRKNAFASKRVGFQSVMKEKSFNRAARQLRSKDLNISNVQTEKRWSNNSNGFHIPKTHQKDLYWAPNGYISQRSQKIPRGTSIKPDLPFFNFENYIMLGAKIGAVKKSTITRNFHPDLGKILPVQSEKRIKTSKNKSPRIMSEPNSGERQRQEKLKSSLFQKGNSQLGKISTVRYHFESTTKSHRNVMIGQELVSRRRSDGDCQKIFTSSYNCSGFANISPLIQRESICVNSRSFVPDKKSFAFSESNDASFETQVRDQNLKQSLFFRGEEIFAREVNRPDGHINQNKESPDRIAKSQESNEKTDDSILSKSPESLKNVMKALSKIIYNRLLRRDKFTLRLDIENSLKGVKIELTHLVNLKNLLTKFMKGETLTEQDLQLSNLEIVLFCLFLVKKRYLDLETLRWDVQSLTNLQSREMLKRSEQNYKVILKRAFRTLISSFNTEHGVIDGSDELFYSHFFDQVSKEHDIEIENFKPQKIFNEIRVPAKARRFQKRKSKKEFASLLKRSPAFITRLKAYLSDNLEINGQQEGIMRDCMKELDRKLPLMIFNWQKRLGSGPEFKQELISFLTRTLVNDKVKLPWSASEVRNGVESVRRLFQKS